MEFLCVCPGPSLTPENCRAAELWAGAGADTARKIIAVNLAWKCLRADLLFAGDAMFWGHEPYRADILNNFHGEKWTASQSAARMYKLKLMLTPILSNSGANAILLASRLGAKRIVLLGYDWGAADDGRLHCHDDHPKPLYNSGNFDSIRVRQMARDLEQSGVEVLNASRRTALDCFKRVELESVVAGVSVTSASSAACSAPALSPR